MRINVQEERPTLFTHEGGKAVQLRPIDELKRLSAVCLMWEDTFYEKGSDIAKNLRELVLQCDPEAVLEVIQAVRRDFKLRHVPLFLTVSLLDHDRGKKGAAPAGVMGWATIVRVAVNAAVRRPDELSELLAMYWQGNKDRPLSAALKKAVAAKFATFDEYQLAKWDRAGKVTLRGVLMMTHPKPKDAVQAAMWKRLLEKDLARPETVESKMAGLSHIAVIAEDAGADDETIAAAIQESKTDRLTGLIQSDKMTMLALLGRLRMLMEAKVDRGLIEQALLKKAPGSWALPFRFISAAKAVPQMASSLDLAMRLSALSLPKLHGETVFVIDGSKSMTNNISKKSEVRFLDAAVGLAILGREMCDSARVFIYSDAWGEVMDLRGLAMLTAIESELRPAGTFLGRCLTGIAGIGVTPDRFIVLTDEQSSDEPPPCWARKGGYIINMSANKPALKLDRGWMRLSGWSEKILDMVRAVEEASS